MIDTVMFDMGGTLEDIYTDAQTKEAAAREVVRILEKHGVAISDTIPEVLAKLEAGWDRYAAYRGPSCRELKPEEIWGSYILTEYGMTEASVRPFAEELAHSWEVTHYHRELRPGVREMLQGLKDMGMKLGVISNTASLYQVFAVLEEYGIRDYFQDVTLSSVTGYRKPDPNIFLVALHQLQSEPERCAYVGDTYSRDVVGPQRLGFAATFHIQSFLTKSRDVDIPEDVRPTYSIQEIGEVYTILRESACV